MSKQRKQYQAAFKSKVALEAIKGVRTVNEIATHYGVHPTQVAQWKKQALDHLREAFSDGRKRHERDRIADGSRNPFLVRAVGVWLVRLEPRYLDERAVFGYSVDVEPQLILDPIGKTPARGRPHWLVRGNAVVDDEPQRLRLQVCDCEPARPLLVDEYCCLRRPG